MIGTDTGIGKTLFSGLFARYLMDAGVGVRAVKPFCSGGKADIEFLRAAQDGNLGQEDLNFWYSDEPISPAAWELRRGQAVDFEDKIYTCGPAPTFDKSEWLNEKENLG